MAGNNDTSFLEAVKKILEDLPENNDFTQAVWDELDFEPFIKEALKSEEVKEKIMKAVAKVIEDSDKIEEILSDENDTTLDEEIANVLEDNEDLRAAVKQAVTKSLKEGSTITEYLDSNFDAIAERVLEDYDFDPDVKDALKDNADVKAAIAESIKSYFDYDANSDKINEIIGALLGKIDLSTYVEKLAEKNPEIKRKVDDAIMAAINNNIALADSVERSIEDGDISTLVTSVISADPQMKTKVQECIQRTLEQTGALDTVVQRQVEQMDLTEPIGKIISADVIGSPVQRKIREGVEQAIASMNFDNPKIQGAIEAAFLTKLIQHPGFSDRANELIDRCIDEGRAEALFDKLVDRLNENSAVAKADSDTDDSHQSQ